MTTVLVASCVLMAGLFAVLAAWMHGQSYRRAARAELAAGACCLLGAAVLPSGQQMLPVLTPLPGFHDVAVPYARDLGTAFQLAGPGKNP